MYALLNLLRIEIHSVTEIVAEVECEFSLPSGVGMALFKRFVLEKRYAIDLNRPINLNEKRVAA